MKYPLSTLGLLCAALLFAACDLFSDRPDSLDDVPRERLIAFTAVYAETLPDGTPIQRIVVADRKYPDVFRIISEKKGVSVQPILSPDGRYVLFGDELHGAVGAPRLVLYDLLKNRADSLSLLWPDGTFDMPLWAPTYPIVWERDSRGFYYTNPHQPYSYRQDVLRYRIDERVFERVHDSGEYLTLVIGIKDADTLVVVSSEPDMPGRTPERPSGVALMTTDGVIHRRARNPDMSYVYDAGEIKQQFNYPIWASSKDNILAVWFAPNPRAGASRDLIHQIIVSGLDEEESRIFDLGDKDVYRYPCWVPGVGIVVEANRYGSTDWRERRLEVINPETGAVRPFANPKTYGAAGLRMPHAGN